MRLIYIPKKNSQFDQIKFGLLYNYASLEDTRKISSSNLWHTLGVDIKDILEFLEPESTIYENTLGGKLKLVTEDVGIWQNPNTGASNSLLLNFKGSGYRTNTGAFGGISTVSCHAEYSDYQGDIIISHSASYNTDMLNFEYVITKKYGTSLRMFNQFTTKNHGETGVYIGNDGKRYETICLYGIEITTQNLAETKYRNGDPIPEVTDNSAWAALTTGALCAYNNDWNNV